ncbi:MAG: hypothetical protein VX938_08930, partial [Myxococcota bacterium]|nr:hypothetical protein [Myxococcota bacterium]
RGLRAIGLMPTAQGEIAALRAGQNLTIVFVLPWLRVLDAEHPDRETVSAALEAHLRSLPLEQLAHRLGVTVPLRARHLESWLEELGAMDREFHLGVRLAAAEAMRGLRDDACHLCGGSGALTAMLDAPVRCPRCDGSGNEETSSAPAADGDV